jgi:hypothetical protein
MAEDPVRNSSHEAGRYTLSAPHRRAGWNYPLVVLVLRRRAQAEVTLADLS